MPLACRAASAPPPARGGWGGRPPPPPAPRLFGPAFPAALLAGIILLGVATPAMAEAIVRILSDALDAARMFAGL